MFMDILRKLAIGLLALILFSASQGMAWADVAGRTLRDRDTVKEWLESSSFYDNLVPAILENAKVETDGQDSELPLGDPALQAKINGVLNADFLRSSSSEIVDGVYNWLEGKSVKPDFNIDLTQTRRDLAAAVGSYAVERAATLPACTTVPADFDPLTAECRPPGVTDQMITAQVENSLLNNEEFLPEQQLTADNLGDNSQAFENNQGGQAVKRVYSLGRFAVPILGLITGLALLGTVLLHKHRPTGLKRAGGILLTSAVILGIGFGLLFLVPDRLNSYATARVNTENEAARTLISRLTDTVAGDIRGVIGIYALVFGLLGLALLVAGFSWNKQTASEKAPISNEPVPPVDDSPKIDPAAKKPDDQKQQPKPPRKIQL